MSQTTAQTSPIEPVQMKAACHPQRAVTAAMRIGAMKAEALEPELKRPVARARSSEGNHSVVALMAAGKFPDSPRPRKIRAMQKPATLVTMEWLMEAHPQTRMARAYPVLVPSLSMMRPAKRKPTP